MPVYETTGTTRDGREYRWETRDDYSGLVDDEFFWAIHAEVREQMRRLGFRDVETETIEETRTHIA